MISRVRFTTEVKDDHRVVVTLPPDVPVGQAELDVTVQSPPPQNITVAEVVRFFLDHAPPVSPRHQEDLQFILKRFCDDHGALPLSQAKPYHLREWVDSKTKWRSDWRKRGVITCVQKAFKFAVKLGYIDRNPFAGVSHAEGERGRPMTREEFDSLFKASDEAFQHVLLFLAYTGAPPVQARELRWPDVDLERGRYTFREPIRRRKSTKPRHRKTRDLPPGAIELLDEIRRHNSHSESDHVFLNSRGRPWTRPALDLRLWRKRKELGLPEDCKLFCIRHAVVNEPGKVALDADVLFRPAGPRALLSEH